MNSARIREAGDSALLLELENEIDVEVNARAVAVADAVRRENIPGIRDILSTYRSVAVHFDPLRTDLESLRSALDRLQTSPSVPRAGKVVDVPVAYGAEYGPDLEDVARFAGITSREVVERHASVQYRVFMLGFLPGFPYLGRVDPTIAAPRRASPRLRVPAGSVGIAGEQTGIYPRQCPGGWQLIGRTALKVFDPARTPAPVFAPGDSVRFVPVDFADVVFGVSRTQNPGDATYDDAERYVTVLRPGMLTTVQDSGRWGYQSEGVAVSGAMDALAHRVANAIVGNESEAATLEVTILGPELRMEQGATIAVAGADLGAAVDGVSVPALAPVVCRPGSTLHFLGRKAGARAYVAFDGGVVVHRTFGSRATHVLSGIGGVSGRAVLAGDRLPLGTSHMLPTRRLGESPVPVPAGGARVRVLPGPQNDWFSDAAFETLQHTRFTVGTNSDRMGYRLTSPKPIPRIVDREMITDATFTGAVQVPPSGEPIVLMSDRQTTGGYPQIATVITADLPVVGQLAPGDWIEFEICSRSEAIAALAAQEAAVKSIE